MNTSITTQNEAETDPQEGLRARRLMNSSMPDLTTPSISGNGASREYPF